MQDQIENWVRKSIRSMKPYSSARHEYTGEGKLFLDANENSFGSPLAEDYSRYPDPLQRKLKEKISKIKAVPVENIFLGNGSDEAIDLLFRVFCEPGMNNVITCPPTYGMYDVCAAVNDIQVKKVSLTDTFQLDVAGIRRAVDPATRMILLCSPNNPTGNSINPRDIETLLESFDGLVVIDEAYVQFSGQNSFISLLNDYPNLVVLQTFSKAWGLAGLRIGMAIARHTVISYMNRVKYPYNINSLTQELAMEALDNADVVDNWTRQIIGQRKWLREQLELLPFVKNVYPSDANFLLVKMENAKTIYEYLVAKCIIVRYREEGLRITVGTPVENDLLIKELKQFNS